jgi:ribosomal protein S27E
MWNEWHVLFDQGRSAWLSDANRDYTIAYLTPPAEVPAFESLRPGMAVTLGGERFSVANIEEAEVVAGEGELPFKFGSGWKAPVADLRGAGARFATIDYSEDVPHVYVGERLPFDTFRFDGLRDPDRPVEPRGRAIAFKCAGCGAPIGKHVATTEVVACGSCGSVTDVTGTVGEIVQKNEVNALQFSPSIPLGSVCKWRGTEYEVVGYMRRRIVVEGEKYEWGEYLLHNLAQGYYWISEYQGHYSLIKAAADEPKVAGGASEGHRPDAWYLGRNFRHFQHSEPEVSYLVGEFNWRVRLGEKCVVDDYVAPPLILSSEESDREITWSVGEYVEPEILWKAFRLKGEPPRRVGVAPNQPSPYKGRPLAYWMAFVAVMAVAVLMQFGFLALDAGTRSSTVAFAVMPGATARTVSPLLDLGSGRDGPVNLHVTTNAQAAWVDLDLQLVEAGSGRAYRLTRQLGNRGLATDWGDGSPEDVASIAALPGGRYTLTIDAKAGAVAEARTGQSEVSGHVRIYRTPPGWSNLMLLAGFLVLWPIVATARAVSFENKRWAESDYPPDESSA